MYFTSNTANLQYAALKITFPKRDLHGSQAESQMLEGGRTKSFKKNQKKKKDFPLATPHL